VSVFIVDTDTILYYIWVFGVLWVLFCLSVPVQLIGFKHSSPKWPIMCRVER